MKKKFLWITVLAVMISFPIMGQNALPAEAREQLQKYFDEQITPALVEQQTIYVNSLSGDEKSALADAACIRRNDSNKKRRARAGNKGINRSDCWNKVTDIVSNHPQENASYQLFLEEHKATWMSEIQAIHDEYAIVPARFSDGEPGYGFWIERLKKPETLLLMDPDQPLRFGMKFYNGKGNKRDNRKVNRQGRYDGNEMNARSATGRANMTSEEYAEMKAFVQNDVLPVIIEKRIAFDVNLTDQEKETIQLARDKKEVRRVMFKAWHESEDFTPGERRDDPDFDDMRADMQASMQAVREIALTHQSEIRQVLDQIKVNEPEWENKVETILGKVPSSRPQKGQGKKMSPIKHWDTPIAFLMFDPAKADTETLFNNNLQIVVTVFPNPVVNTGTIRINRAMNKKVVATLFTKEGNQIQELFSGQVNQDIFSIPFTTDSLEDGLYLIRVEVDETPIIRKVMVKRE